MGVDDSGGILGLDKDFSTLQDKNKDGFERELTNVIFNYIDIGKMCRGWIRVSFEEMDEKLICVVKVSKASRPTYLINKNKEYDFFIRTGNSTRELNTKEANEYIKEHWKESKISQNFLNLLLLLSNYLITWHDHKSRPVNPEVTRMRDHIRLLGQDITALSFESDIESEELDKKLKKVGTDMKNLSNKEVYMDGGVSWSAFCEEGDRINEFVESLIVRVQEKISPNDEEQAELQNQLVKSLKELIHTWNQASEGQIQDIYSIPELLEEIYYKIYRFTYIPTVIDDEDAKSLRSISKTIRTLTSQGVDPIKHISESMDAELKKVKEIIQKYSAQSNK